MTTRGTLFTDVRNWTARTADTDLDAALPTLLRNVEARLAREVYHHSMVGTTSLFWSTGNNISLPTNTLEAISLTLVSDSQAELQLVSSEVLREGPYFGSTGNPCVYAIEGRNIYFAPVPVAPTGGAVVQLFDLVHLQRFADMVNDADTTTLLEDHYDLYLYAMLAEYARWAQDQQAALQFEAKYADVRMTLESQNIDYQSGGSIMRRVGRGGFVV